MKIEYFKVADYKPLYDYYNSVRNKIPYWFDADFSVWEKSFVSDTDYDGEEMFAELITYAAYYDDKITGFIQFGISNYIYGTDGGKDHTRKGGIIRNLYYDENTDFGNKLIAIAEEYFACKKIQYKFAFFHAFGMTANAGHGKLYCGLSYIEQVLNEYGYFKEHENVYYKRLIAENDIHTDNDIEVKYGESNPKGMCNFSIYYEGVYVGAGALVYLPQGNIAYLKWIYIEDIHQGKGHASAALNKIFSDLYSKGISRIDTDTADGNFIAQKLYTKTGFENMGRTRSYLK